VKGAVNIPLVEGKVALRLSGATLNRDGYVKRLMTAAPRATATPRWCAARCVSRPPTR
jgi:iron complex outermembrane receptor protein